MPLEVLVERVALEVAVGVRHDVALILLGLHRVADRAVAGLTTECTR